MKIDRLQKFMLLVVLLLAVTGVLAAILSQVSFIKLKLVKFKV